MFELACRARLHAPELLLKQFWEGRSADLGPVALSQMFLETHQTDGLLRRDLTLQSFAERTVVTKEGSRHIVIRARLDNEWFALKEFSEVCEKIGKMKERKKHRARV